MLRVSLRDVALQLGHDAVVLQAVEEGRLDATPELLQEWSEILLASPKRSRVQTLTDNSIEVVAALALIVAVVAFAAAMLR
jgi:hypothetical protein